MRRSLFIASAMMVCAIVVAFSCNNPDSGKQTKDNELSKEELIKRGEYLVTIAGCDDCHSPKVMTAKGPEVDPQRRLSGYPANRPLPAFDSNVVKKGQYIFNEDFTATAGFWGVSFSANLTSDPTGAGSWTLENFTRALRKGKYKGMEGGRDLLPPMPWINFSKMPDEDIKAVYTFLQSTKPVENVVPATRPLAEIKTN